MPPSNNNDIIRLRKLRRAGKICSIIWLLVGIIFCAGSYSKTVTGIFAVICILLTAANLVLAMLIVRAHEADGVVAASLESTKNYTIEQQRLYFRITIGIVIAVFIIAWFPIMPAEISIPLRAAAALTAYILVQKIRHIEELYRKADAINHAEE